MAHPASRTFSGQPEKPKKIKRGDARKADSWFQGAASGPRHG